jgi:hypothetical protein
MKPLLEVMIHMTKKNDETIKNEKKNNEQANTVKNKK